MKDVTPKLKTWDEIFPEHADEPDWQPEQHHISKMLRVWQQDHPELGNILPTWPEPAQEDFSEFADLIPDAEEVAPLSTSQQAISDAMDSMSIIDAYARYCGKMKPKIGKRQTESIMISCPRPGHTDSNPSAWMNSRDGLWHCGTCEVGGDKWDLASFKAGINIGTPGRRDAEKFIELTKWVAKDMGMSTIEMDGKPVIAVVPPTAPEPEPEPEKPTHTVIEVVEPEEEMVVGVRIGHEDEPHLAEVVPISAAFDIDHKPQPEKSLEDWKALIPQDTFLAEYMRTGLRVDEQMPVDWHLMLGLSACGLVIGHHVKLDFDGQGDRASFVRPNLFICIYGATGIGKSRAITMMRRVVAEVSPYDRNDPTSTGVKMIAMPGSAEALIDEFVAEEVDPHDGAVTPYRVIGMLRVDEFSDLVSRSSRAGNATVPILQGLYDGGDVMTRSRAHGHVSAHDPFCTMITSTQPQVASKLFNDEAISNGWLNRYVFVAGPAGRITVPFTAPQVSFDDAIHLLGDVKAYYRQYSSRNTITLDDSARSAYLDLWTRRFKPIADQASQVQNRTIHQDPRYRALARIEWNWKKLLCCMAMNEQTEVIDGDLIERAELLLCDRIERDALSMFEDVTTSEMDMLIGKIMEKLESRTAKEGHKAFRMWGRGGFGKGKFFEAAGSEKLERALNIGAKLSMFMVGHDVSGRRIIWLPEDGVEISTAE